MNTATDKTTKPAHPSKASTEKQEEREFWHKIVVKVLKWKESTACPEKITLKEWNFYHKSTLKINESFPRAETLKKLNAVKDMILKNGGFADKI